MKNWITPSVENHETLSVSGDIRIAFADSNNTSSMLGDLAIAMQTLASTTIQNEAFNPQ